ncbi:hypothetical protein EH223_13910 [candidate division KSB1 bacterium]|nr:MAG: hypothetical protein EH223_13910 [candidate division KSB1 bacterium]
MQIGLKNDKSRNVTKKDIIIAVIIIVYSISALIIGELYSKTITGIMFSLLFVVAIVQILNLPKEEKSAIAAAMEEHDKTLMGRLMKIVHYILYLAVIVGIIMWLANKI